MNLGFYSQASVALKAVEWQRTYPMDYYANESLGAWTVNNQQHRPVRASARSKPPRQKKSSADTAGKTDTTEPQAQTKSSSDAPGKTDPGEGVKGSVEGDGEKSADSAGKTDGAKYPAEKRGAGEKDTAGQETSGGKRDEATAMAEKSCDGCGGGQCCSVKSVVEDSIK